MSSDSKPRVGIPYRTLVEQIENKRDRYERYLLAVRNAGGEIEEIPLDLSPTELEQRAVILDAIVLPGSPADVDPAQYGAEPHPKTERADADRERTDIALLKSAFARQRPVLTICYGTQLLNVFCRGNLLQDISTAVRTEIKHDRKGMPSGVDPEHLARLEPDSELARLAGTAEVRINSSHHQAIDRLGSGLRATAHAPDGVIEAVEWTGDSNWVVGVQWHPERMMGHPLSEALFRQLVLAASAVLRPK